MMKLFTRYMGSPSRFQSYDRTDPMSHPMVQRMTQRELADLPLNRR